MAFRVVAPTLDLWPKVKEFYLHTFCESGFYGRMNIDLPTLEGFYLVAMAGGAFGVVLLAHDDACNIEGEDVVGFSLLDEDQAWRNLERVRYAHIRGVFLKPNLPRAAGRRMNEGVDQWARSRGLNYVQGYVRGGFKHDAANHLYGYHFEYSIISKNLDLQERS